MNDITNKTKTILCVSIAGLFFIPSVIFNLWYIAIIGAFFDWLPLPTGWMKTKKQEINNKTMIVLHVIVTLIAYAFLIIWIIFPNTLFRFLFLEIWWIAVILGVFITK